MNEQVIELSVPVYKLVLRDCTEKIVIILFIRVAVGIFLDMLTTLYIDPVDCQIHLSA